MTAIWERLRTLALDEVAATLAELPGLRSVLARVEAPELRDAAAPPACVHPAGSSNEALSRPASRRRRVRSTP